MRKVLSVLISLILVFVSCIFMNVPVSAKTETGSLGALTWALNNSSGELVISGKGDMSDSMLVMNNMQKHKDNVKRIIIEEGVESVSSNAFFDFDNLFEVVIDSKDFIIIYHGAFSDCDSLTSIYVNEENKSLCSVNGVLFDKEQEELISYPAGKQEDTYSIPNTVQKIEESAFEGCKSLTDISIPDSITCIGDDAFLNTGYYNESTNWENDLLYIGDFLVDSKSDLTAIEIKEGTKLIAEDVFLNCGSLVDITIPNSVIYIGKNAFYGTGCYSDEYNWQADIFYIDDCLIEANTEIFGSYKIKDGTRLIADDAFYQCEKVENIILPDSVEYIGKYTFTYCESLKSIEIPNKVKDIGEYAFDSCESLENVQLSKNLTNLKGNVFNDCKSLNNVKIPYGVKNIGDFAFANCDLLTSVVIPGSVENIGSFAFAFCGSLTDLTIYDGVKNIGDCAFYCSELLTTVTIPKSVEKMGINVFGGYYFNQEDFSVEDFVIIGYKNSEAERFAKEHNMNFVEISFIERISIFFKSVWNKIIYLF